MPNNEIVAGTVSRLHAFWQGQGLTADFLRNANDMKEFARCPVLPAHFRRC
jgi:hypothetical protein